MRSEAEVDAARAAVEREAKLTPWQTECIKNQKEREESKRRLLEENEEHIKARRAENGLEKPLAVSVKPEPAKITASQRTVEVKPVEPMSQNMKLVIIVCAAAIVIAWILRPSRYSFRVTENGAVYMLDSSSGRAWTTRSTSSTLSRIEEGQ